MRAKKREMKRVSYGGMGTSEEEEEGWFTRGEVREDPLPLVSFKFLTNNPVTFSIYFNLCIYHRPKMYIIRCFIHKLRE